MNASTGKTLGIVLLVLLGLMLLWPLKLLLLAPVGALHGVFDGWPGIHLGRIHFGAWPWIGFAGIFGLALLALGIAILVWVYNDAEKRGLSGALWAILVFFLHFLGFIIYLIVRAGHPIPIPGRTPPAGGPAAGPAAGPTPPAPPVPPQPAGCPQCGKPVAPAHAYCPTCGTKQ